LTVGLESAYGTSATLLASSSLSGLGPLLTSPDDAGMAEFDRGRVKTRLQNALTAAV
jgi:hypothetical protein